MRSEKHKKAGVELNATCHICLKTKFADGVGHICNYCDIRCCARCGGKVTLRSSKVSARELGERSSLKKKKDAKEIAGSDRSKLLRASSGWPIFLSLLFFLASLLTHMYAELPVEGRDVKRSYDEKQK